MATLTTITTAKSKFACSMPACPTVNSVVTKTISFAVPTGTSTNGYYTGDTIRIRNLFPKGTELLGFWWKASVTQGATLTLAPGIYTSGTATSVGTLNTAAFVSAVALQATTMIRPTLVPGTASINTLCLLTDGDLGIVLAGTTVGTTAATITLTFQYASVEPTAGITTITA
jgi:hypothetical protein